jgi:D-amino-acid oxidase
LTAAAVLQDRVMKVENWSRDDPLATTSAVAAAIWYPYLAEPRERVQQWAAVTFRRLRQLADDPATGVTMVRTIELLAAPEPEPFWAAAAGGTVPATGDELPPGARHARVVTVPLCDTTRYLPWLRDRFLARGGRLVRREVKRLDEATAVASTVVNCTGLGARELCGDHSLRPARGQVVCTAPTGLRTAILDDTDPERPVYVLPRGADIVVGGTLQMDDARLAPDRADTMTILAAGRALHPALLHADILVAKVGLRPYRPTVRLELERLSAGLRVVHDYGHGGSGFTLAWGCAEEVAQTLSPRSRIS